MIVRGTYRDGKVELDQPLDLPDGSPVEVEVRSITPEEEDEAWRELGTQRMQEEWDNPQHAIYDGRRLDGDPLTAPPEGEPR